jgi:hypothetical protein
MSRMARPEGFEPPTRCLEGSRSIHLSYGRMRGRLSVRNGTHYSRLAGHVKTARALASSTHVRQLLGNGGDDRMERATGLEPATTSLEGWCSTN